MLVLRRLDDVVIERERPRVLPVTLFHQPMETIVLIQKGIQLASEFGMERQKLGPARSLARFDRLKVGGQDFKESPLVSRLSPAGSGRGPRAFRDRGACRLAQTDPPLGKQVRRSSPPQSV